LLLISPRITNGLRSYIKLLKERFIRYPNNSKATHLHLVFSTHFSVFGYPDETLFLVFGILHNATLKVTKLSILENSMSTQTTFGWFISRLTLHHSFRFSLSS